jgi:transcriptional regulator GlxA family with amidase domain
MLAEDWEKLAIQAEFKPGDMAYLSGTTLRQMERRFRREIGVTPTEWIRRFRCRLVLKLITEGYKNKAIAVELKFGNEAQLCHDFRRVYGASPKSFVPMPADQLQRKVQPAGIGCGPCATEVGW